MSMICLNQIAIILNGIPTVHVNVKMKMKQTDVTDLDEQIETH